MVKRKPGFVDTDSKQAADSFVFVPFHIEKQKDQSLCSRQLHHGPLQMDALDVSSAIDKSGFGDALASRFDTQRESSHRSEFTNLSQESLVKVLGPGVGV